MKDIKSRPARPDVSTVPCVGCPVYPKVPDGLSVFQVALSALEELANEAHIDSDAAFHDRVTAIFFVRDVVAAAEPEITKLRLELAVAKAASELSTAEREVVGKAKLWEGAIVAYEDIDIGGIVALRLARCAHDGLLESVRALRAQEEEG